ncbi:MAG: 23S rRNA (adenine(2503)-C(2))-methyltransferase RlmN, partial [Kiritimatiellae bacterium]|nr:23S rRNA (adenine(2503)-C(2))-methyltransferase RlmN [Kiritimatiellia bacterium]
EYLARSRCHLALSLHSPFDEERRQWMPVQKAYPISKVLEELRRYPLERQRRIMLEYVCFDGVNDTPRHVKEMARALNGLRARVNLMRFHPIPGLPLQGSSEARLRAFQEGLRSKGIIATIRRSRGLDIAAACGLLSTRERNRGGPPPPESAAG